MKSGFRHEAVIYGDPGEFLVATVPFLRDALEAGEAALVAVSRTNTELLRGELGADAERVRFTEMEELGRNPARIIPFWHEFVEEHDGLPVRGVGEPVWPGRGAAEIDECQRHESLLNLAFADSAEWSLLCPYDGTAFDDEVLAAVRHSHKALTREGLRELSSDFARPADCFAGELPAHPAGLVPFEFGRTDLAAVRRRVERGAAEAGLSRLATADLVVAASELAANSVAHGGGGGRLRIWRETGRLLVEFTDRGTIAEPLAGRVRPSLTQEGGRGLWLVNQLCDLVQIRSGALGTTVRLQAVLG
jgi:anti-sigma regulatory factor (Ser/Thr protein kinase)